MTAIPTTDGRVNITPSFFHYSNFYRGIVQELKALSDSLFETLLSDKARLSRSCRL